MKTVLIDKNTPTDYLIYLAKICNKEIKECNSINIKCREEGKYYNKRRYYFTDIIEKINLAGLKTDITGKIS